jgi:hypothetical protein
LLLYLAALLAALALGPHALVAHAGLSELLAQVVERNADDGVVVLDPADGLIELAREGRGESLDGVHGALLSLNGAAKARGSSRKVQRTRAEGAVQSTIGIVERYRRCE